VLDVGQWERLLDVEVDAVQVVGLQRALEQRVVGGEVLVEIGVGPLRRAAQHGRDVHPGLLKCRQVRPTSGRNIVADGGSLLRWIVPSAVEVERGEFDVGGDAFSGSGET